MSKTAVVLVAEGIEEIEAVTPGDVLNRCGVDVTYASVGGTGEAGTEITGGHHVPMRADCSIDELGEILFDAVVVPGGGKGAENLHRSELASAFIRRHFDAGKVVAAICASPAVVLAPLGILTGRHATCFPGLERRFGPEVRVCDTTVCVDGNIITSRGPGTAMEFSLKIAEALTTHDTAVKAGRAMLVAGL